MKKIILLIFILISAVSFGQVAQDIVAEDIYIEGKTTLEGIEVSSESGIDTLICIGSDSILYKLPLDSISSGMVDNIYKTDGVLDEDRLFNHYQYEFYNKYASDWMYTSGIYDFLATDEGMRFQVISGASSDTIQSIDTLVISTPNGFTRFEDEVNFVGASSVFTHSISKSVRDTVFYRTADRLGVGKTYSNIASGDAFYGNGIGGSRRYGTSGAEGNTFIGNNVAYDQTNGNDNVAIGLNTLFKADTAWDNTLCGRGVAGYLQDTNKVSFFNNTIYGHRSWDFSSAGLGDDSCYNNLGMGLEILQENNKGNTNVMFSPIKMLDGEHYYDLDSLMGIGAVAHPDSGNHSLVSVSHGAAAWGNLTMNAVLYGGHFDLIADQFGYVNGAFGITRNYEGRDIGLADSWGLFHPHGLFEVNGELGGGDLDGDTVFVVLENGNVGINTLTPTVPLYVNGAAYVKGLFDVDGDGLINDTLSVGMASQGDSTLNSTSADLGNLNCDNKVSIATTNLTFGGNITLEGDVEGAGYIYQSTDHDTYLRFLDGRIIMYVNDNKVLDAHELSSIIAISDTLDVTILDGALDINYNGGDEYVDVGGDLTVLGEIKRNRAIHLYSYYGDSAVSKSYTTGWAHLSNVGDSLYVDWEMDGFTWDNDTIVFTDGGDYDLLATNTCDGDNGETVSIRFYNVTQTAGIPVAGAATMRAANNFFTIVTSSYAEITAGDRVVMQYKGDASGTSVFKNGSIKINKVHE